LYATKLNEDLDIQWQITYDDGKELALSDFIADKNGDLAVVGGYWDEQFFGQYQGFLFKIFHDGSLTSISIPEKENGYLLKIYPCPASDNIYLELEHQIAISGDIISLDGSIIQTFMMTNNKEIIDISKLPAGNYYIRLFDGKLNFLSITKFVKI